jgi:3-phosphoglycerate kinase
MFVNDAFGAAHRAHASTEGVAHCLSPAAMGLLMEKELRYLQDELATPERPFLVILGGAKVSDKIGVIKALMEKADVFLIGGAMAYTFYRALGIPTGASRVEGDKVHLAEELLRLAQQKGIKFLLPVDNIETDEFKAGAHSRNTPLLSKERGITDGWEAVDIGSATIRLFEGEIEKAKTVLWNGPVGVFEIPDFANGTKALAEAVARSSAKSIIGGGDSVTAVKQFGLADRMTFISTGGGASLELLEGKTLPGVAALTDS